MSGPDVGRGETTPTYNVVLEYFGARRSDGPKARAWAVVRYTRSQVVLERGAPRTVEQLRGGARIGLQGEYRWRRDNGQRIPHYRFGSGWELSEWDRGGFTGT